METTQRASRVVWCLLLVCGLAGVSGREVPRMPRLVHRTPALHHTRIVGGNITTQGQFPSMVALYHHALFGKSFICGGTLLNTNHVLTAAHCIKGYSASSIEVVAGEQDLNHKSGLEQSYRGTFKVVHDYSTTTGANDIAILRTSDHFTLEEGVVEVVALPYDYQTPPAMCTAVGWGYTEVNGKISSDLRAAEIPTLTDQECIDDVYGPDLMMLDMMCAGYMNGGPGICDGDGGGPLYCDGVIMGISSRGRCESIPAIFTEVSHFLDWIKINIEA